MNPEDFFDVLADAERRRILKAMVQTGDASHVGLLKERCEASASLLHHVHLPKMDRAGLVEFDPRTGDIELTDVGADVKLFLQALEEMQTTDELPKPQAF
jgi:predicted transcriptional regulator